MGHPDSLRQARGKTPFTSAGCLGLHSAAFGWVGDFKCRRETRLPKKEKIMLRSQHAEAAELHTHAAYAHAAAECQYSTGDHVCAQSLTRQAYERSQEAAQLSKEIAKHEPDLMEIQGSSDQGEFNRRRSVRT
jgi:hypothetical protein